MEKHSQMFTSRSLLPQMSAFKGYLSHKKFVRNGIAIRTMDFPETCNLTLILQAYNCSYRNVAIKCQIQCDDLRCLFAMFVVFIDFLESLTQQAKFSLECYSFVLLFFIYYIIIASSDVP